MASGFGAWRNDCDRWEGILKLTRDQPRELELTLGCRQESLVAYSLVPRILQGWSDTICRLSVRIQHDMPFLNGLDAAELELNPDAVLQLVDFTAGIKTQNRDGAPIRACATLRCTPLWWSFQCRWVRSSQKNLALAYLQGNLIDRHGAAKCLANSGDSNDWMHVVCRIGQFGGLVTYRLPLTSSLR